MTQSYKNVKNSASRDFKSYRTQQDLPLSGLTDGTMAYVEDVRTLYVFDEGAWYGIRLKNDPPVISAAPPARVVLSRGNTYTFNLDAEDPDGLPVTWSYEIIEGVNTGITVTLVGSEFNLTNNTNGTACVIQFSVTDGVNTVTTTTRFVLDDMVGLQGNTFSKSSQTTIPYSEASFYAQPTGFQYDSSVPVSMRLSAGSTGRIEYFNSTNLAQLNGDRSTSDEPIILINGRALNFQFNNKLFEFTLTNPEPQFSPQVALADYASTASTMQWYNQCWDKENDDTLWIAGYDNNNIYEVKIYKYFVSSTKGSDLVELANKSQQWVPGDNHYPRKIMARGNKLILLVNVASKRHIAIFDKITLEFLGNYDHGSGNWDNASFGACENFLFVNTGTTQMFDISDPENISLVDGVSFPTGRGVFLMSERLVLTGGFESGGIALSTAYLYDFDSLRGTLSNQKTVSIPNPYFSGIVHGTYVDDRLYLGHTSSQTVDSNYQAYVYYLHTPT